MAFDTTDIVLSLLKIAIVVGALLQVTPIMVWVERRGSALIQDRVGPNRIGPFGLIQSFADALKFVLKEDFTPGGANKWLFTIAPLFGLLPALTTIAVVPWGRPFLIPDAILYGNISTIGWALALLLLFLGIIVIFSTVRVSSRGGASKLNIAVGWLLGAALVLGGLAVIAALAGLRGIGGALRIPGGNRIFEPIVADVNVGLLLVFALASMGVYGVVMAGWASNNKYSLFGGIRASAQMISYELSLSLAAVSALLVGGSLRLTDVVVKQTGYFVLFDTVKIPAWNCFSPAMWIAFVVFVVAAFAETNRLPFDFAEAEAELVAGYHTEYSSMKFALFFMSEYIAMATMSALIVTLFLGGWDIPWYNEPPTFFGFLLSALAFVAKVTFMLFVFVWVRWTIPRLKYDILMKAGWKIFLPLALVNLLIVAMFIAKGWI
ncbi:MAG TPA: complex I subunit 1 family protein [Thermoanaerobaculia bacterium]|nr:complex I subunit 1 family protein [Thermoanaerobaculia bacterium]